METDKIFQRAAFVQSYASGMWSMTDLCEHYGVSRPTGYRWVSRYIEGDELSLHDRSHAPHGPANRIDPELEALIVEQRELFHDGAKKIRRRLIDELPERHWPSLSTFNNVLDRHGLLHKRRRRNRWKHPGVAALQTDEPNQVWPADFKGHFKTRDGVYCYPLTITDHNTRKLIACEGLLSTHLLPAQAVFERAFRTYGLPEAIRTDNGPPFASYGIYGLTMLNVWWMKLGIVHQRIHPASPQENGQHERMHADLKVRTTRPPQRNLADQQRSFDEFRNYYNKHRPHEAIDGHRPDALYHPSPRPMPERLPEPEYPSHFEVRKVSASGTIRMRHQRFLSTALKGEWIGLEETDDGIWDIVFFNTLLGRIDNRDGTITGV